MSLSSLGWKHSWCWGVVLELSQPVVEQRGNNAVVLMRWCVRERLCACVCIWALSFSVCTDMRSLAHCLSARKMQTQQRTPKGLLVILPLTPLLSLSHLVPLVNSVPLSQSSVGLNGRSGSALPPTYLSSPIHSLSQFPIHALLSFFSYARQSSHGHRLDETELPVVATETMTSDERRLCGGQKSKASSFVSLKSCAHTAVNKHTHTDTHRHTHTCPWGHCQSPVMSVFV